jgi:HD superfamily phosphodiesterase
VNQPESAVQHFHEKLVHIHERLKTAQGRKLGERRHRRVKLTISLCRTTFAYDSW